MTFPRGAFGGLLPAIVVALYFVLGFLAFIARAALWGVPRDREMEARGQSALVGGLLRNYFVWIMRPLWRALVAAGVSANTVTAMAALLGVGAGVSVGLGRFALGGWLFLFSGILDALDGRLARARGQVTALGSAFDSVLDRYVDAAMLAGLAWYFRSSWVLLPVLAALLGTSMVPYVRAKADSLGIVIKDGLMQRPERILYLGVTVAFSPIVDALLPPGDFHAGQRLAAAGIVFLAITSNVTAAGRFSRLLTALRGSELDAQHRQDLNRAHAPGRQIDARHAAARAKRNPRRDAIVPGRA